MSAILKFLNAARSLANQGLSKEAIEQFARNEFGEISELFQKQINNIFKPGKGITSIKKDPDFDDTVIKLPIDDQGLPFNPKDPLKDYSKKPKKAEGGRIGFKEGNGDGDGITGIALSIEERMERIRKLLKQMQDIQKGKGIDPDPEEKAEGGRIGLKAGMSKRAFLKLMGGAGAGLAALKTGALKLLGKEAAPVATEVVKSDGSTAPPPYFIKLMEKIKFMGEKRKTPSYKERVNEYTYTGKDGSDYELIEDLDTGNIKITKDKLGGANYGDDISYETIEDRTEMVFRKGQADETTKGKKPPDEYEEYKVEFDQDGTAADAADIDEISKMEIVEEAGDPDSLTLKKAGGGIARMLGE